VLNFVSPLRRPYARSLAARRSNRAVEDSLWSSSRVEETDDDGVEDVSESLEVVEVGFVDGRPRGPCGIRGTEEDCLAVGPREVTGVVDAVEEALSVDADGLATCPERTSLGIEDGGRSSSV
jgi:hypothetical protein